MSDFKEIVRELSEIGIEILPNQSSAEIHEIYNSNKHKFNVMIEILKGKPNREKKSLPELKKYYEHLLMKMTIWSIRSKAAQKYSYLTCVENTLNKADQENSKILDSDDMNDIVNKFINLFTKIQDKDLISVDKLNLYKQQFENVETWDSLDECLENLEIQEFFNLSGLSNDHQNLFNLFMCGIFQI